MTMIINNQEVEKVLTMPDTIAALEKSYLQLAAGEAVCRPRIDIRIPTSDPARNYQWGTMEGGSTAGYFAIRMKSDIMTWPKDENGNWTEEKYCREPGTYCGLILLISTRNAEPLAFINDGVLQHFRVGGGAGIGVKYLAREDTHVVGMLGSGGMARSHVESFLCVRRIRKLQVFSPTRANRASGREGLPSRSNKPATDKAARGSPRATAEPRARPQASDNGPWALARRNTTKAETAPAAKPAAATT